MIALRTVLCPVDFSRASTSAFHYALAAAEGTEWAEIAAGFPDAADSPAWPWVRLIAGFDPIPHWKALDAPVFVGVAPYSTNNRRIEAWCPPPAPSPCTSPRRKTG